MAKKKASPKQTKPPSAKQARYPRHSVEKALRIPKAILDQNAGKPCTLSEAGGYLGLKAIRGPFSVEIGSAKKYGFVDTPEPGKIRTTELGRRVLRPKSPEDQLKAYREAVLQAPDISDVYKHYRGENIPKTTSSRIRSRTTLGYQKLIFRISNKFSWSRWVLRN